MRASGAPASAAISSSCERWSIASAMIVGDCGARVVAQWMWLISVSRRSALWREPCSRKYCSSGQVGLSGEQSRRETANAPQALA